MGMDLVPHPDGPDAAKPLHETDSEGSALQDFLGRSVIYERAGAAIPRDLLRFGLYSAAVIVGTGILALVLPSPTHVRHGGFFLLFASQAAGLTSVIQSLAVPLIVLGGTLALLDAFLAQGRRASGWRSVIVAQAAVGGAGGFMSGAVAALVLISLLLWVLIAVAAVALIGIIGVAVCGDG